MKPLEYSDSKTPKPTKHWMDDKLQKELMDYYEKKEMGGLSKKPFFHLKDIDTT